MGREILRNEQNQIIFVMFLYNTALLRGMYERVK